MAPSIQLENGMETTTVTEAAGGDCNSGRFVDIDMDTRAAALFTARQCEKKMFQRQNAWKKKKRKYRYGSLFR